MTVKIEIHGEKAADAVAELRTLARELLPSSEAHVGAPSVVVESRDGGGTASESESVVHNAAPVPSPFPSTGSGEVVDLKEKKRGRPRKQSQESSPALQAVSPPVAPAVDVIPSVAPATTSTPAEVTDQMLREKLTELVGDGSGMAVVTEIVGHFGFERVKTITAEARPQVYAAAVKALAGQPWK